MQMISKLELFTPSEKLAKLGFAIAYDLDTNYVEIHKYSLRTRKNNLLEIALQQSIRSLYQLGKKIYVTLNIHARIPKYEQELANIIAI